MPEQQTKRESSSGGAATVDGSTKVVAVWGHPVAHSRSPAMQNAAIAALGLNWIYVPFDVAPDSLNKAVGGLRSMGFVGANCTVPLKERVGSYLDFIDPEAHRIGSVNTIVRDAGGALTGYSTDGPGLLWDLRRNNLTVAGRNVLIWGAGGSARAVACALTAAGAEVTIANRTHQRAVEVAELAGGAAVGLVGSAYENALATADLLVNTTTLGMGDGAMPPMPNGFPVGSQAVYDLVYAPAITPLIAKARKAGCLAVNGLGMLVCQGALSLALWSGRPADEMPIDIMTAALAC
jgi:shikimate dehydrogenase